MKCPTINVKRGNYTYEVEYTLGEESTVPYILKVNWLCGMDIFDVTEDISDTMMAGIIDEVKTQMLLDENSL